MVDINEVKKRIIEIIAQKGPSLPIQIARELNINSLFISAFLSELVDDKKIKVSFLKVGGSPLYFLGGQEALLERFYNYLHPKEAEAFLLLKEHKVLKEDEQEPAVRVALRSIRDFSTGFRINNNIYWKHILVPESDALEILRLREKPALIIKEKTEKREEKKEERREERREEKTEEKREINEKPREIEKPVRIRKKNEERKQEELFENPLASRNIEKPKKEKTKSEFVLKVIDFLERNNFKILEEKHFKAKEYFFISQFDTRLGPIDFLTLAKEKKNVSEKELQELLSKAQAIPLPALFLYTNDLGKKAKEYQEKYHSILKVKKIE